MRSIAQHSNPQLASIVSTPKYPTASVAPVIHGTHAYSFPSHNGPEFANIQAITNVATDGTTQRNVNDSSSESEGSGIVVESGRISIEIPHQVPASMPSLRSRHPSDDNRLGSQQSIATLSVSERDGLPRWCDICKTVKPDRSHHCSECNSCVLRMDHHCPWVNGCIGFGNYKYFYLFIFYGSVSSIWVVVTMVPILVQVNNPTHSLDIQWIAITAIAFLLMLMIVSFTGAHTFYILGNRTTIEVLQDMRNTFIRVQYQKMDQAPEGISDLLPQGAGMLPSFISEIEYNVVMVDQGERLWDQGSWLANWNTVMGPTWWLWFVPCHNTLGDGIHDVYNEQVYSRLVGDALAQARVQAVNFGLPSDLSSSCNTGPANGRNIGMSEGRVAAGVTGISTVPQPPPRPDSESTKDIGPPGSPSSTIPATRDSSSASPGNDPHPSVVLNMDVCRVSTSAGGPSIPRKSSGLSGSVLIPSIRPESPNEDPTTSPSTASGRPMQTDQSEYVSDYYYQPPRLNQLDIPQDLYADEGLASQEGGSGGGGNSTPKRSTRNQSSRQRSLKSLSASPARRRQRTMSGGTGGSYAGPIKEFGMGLGMDGVPVDSGTGLKLSSGLRGWSSQSQGHSQGSSLGHGHGKGYPRQQQQD
ncbi:palmitoyltransferase pfa5 [Dissophora ornata]|nr:palmitoyltransferase pfa5 [Dissophora ornata]